MSNLLEITKPIALENEFDSDFSLNQQVDSFSHESYIFPVALDNYVSIKSKIQEFAYLSEDWDNYGASVVPQEVISNAKLFIEKLSPPILSKLSAENVTPTNYGTIVFDWYDSEENFVSIEIGNAKIGGFYEFNGKSTPLSDEYTDALEDSEFLNIINRLYKSQFTVNA